MLEATPDLAPAHAAYMPLFVAPQPVRSDFDDSGDSDDEFADYLGPDADDENGDRPAGRRRRRGRRGRGRGRGSEDRAGTAGDLDDTQRYDSGDAGDAEDVEGIAETGDTEDEEDEE